MSIRVSVVLPTYQSPEMLARCLSALAGQDFDPAEYEIIVTGDRDCQAVRQVVDEQAGQKIAYCFIQPGDNEQDRHSNGQQVESGISPSPAIRYLPASENRGLAAVRNRGWRAARGEIIAFIAEDCIPSSGWLKSGCRAIDGGAAGVGGQVILPLPDRPTAAQVSLAGLEQAEFPAANCFFRRSLLEELGGFDERFTMAYGQDSDLYFTLLERQDPLATAPEAVVFHRPAASPWGWSLSLQRKSMFNALLYKKHPRLYAQRLARRLPGLYYLNSALLLLSALAGLLGFWQAAGVGALVWLLLSLLLSLERLQKTTLRGWHVVEVFLTSIFIPPLALFWRVFGSLKFGVVFI
jgi:GT2 family glycosyltransferase